MEKLLSEDEWLDVFNSTVTKRLRELHITNPKLAKMTGISYNGLLTIRNGNAMPHMRNMIRICKALGISSSWFIANMPKSVGAREKGG